MKKLKFGILTGSASYSQPLIDAIIKRGHDCRVIDPAKQYQLITENEHGFDRIYDGARGDAEPDRITANSLDIVIPRLGSGSDYGAALLRFMMENLGIYSPVNPAGILFASNKAWTLQRLSALGIAVPRTIVTSRPSHISWMLDKLGGENWVIKTVKGSQGNGVAAAHERRSAASLFEFCYKAGLKVIVESFVDADGKDIRAWVVGDRVVLAMERTAAPGGWKANLAQAGSGKKIELSDEDKLLCVKAAQAVGLNIAGVDIMKEKETGRSLICEINSNPGTKIIDITGVNPFEAVIDFCEKNYNLKPAERSATPLTPDMIRANGLEEQLRTTTAQIERLQKELEKSNEARDSYLKLAGRLLQPETTSKNEA